VGVVEPVVLLLLRAEGDTTSYAFSPTHAAHHSIPLPHCFSMVMWVCTDDPPVRTGGGLRTRMPGDALGFLMTALGSLACGVLLSCSPSTKRTSHSLTSSLMRWHQILRSAVVRLVELKLTELRWSFWSTLVAFRVVSLGACTTAPAASATYGATAAAESQSKGCWTQLIT
jgi:uncharacterized ParB-like nuclease family protein